ncbi:putative integral membrane protein (TIGR00698 family) [Murinocardiopsis flavida]|uniref:Putative integral membrane protein (TIGR00698 family) n=1 Tax=Murinocardiopsis flavida TaxID=645275 RepID=A0A2P8DTU0_9ACTN|nr:putative sulfate exporter family transporter [Murinocardiopsis flavida]PSL00640.1 putative integral membrane protein (TIGR00698 family) [Murinocardiopsis flavida]
MPAEHHTSGPAAPPAPAPVAAHPRRRERAAALLPGAAVTVLGTGAALAVNALVPAVSALMAALLAGALLANLGLLRPATGAGLKAASKTPMRAGIVLLGLQLSLSDVLGLGAPVLAAVLVTVAAAFFGTVLAARRLGLGTERGLLVAAGTSICGASAVAAMSGAVDAEEEDVMTAVALVTLFGTVSIAVLPMVHGALGMDAAVFGAWAGASVHEVGQVAAAAGVVGPAALAPAVVVKLTRVALLAPMMIGVSLWLRRKGAAAPDGARPPIVPLFVAGFLAAVGIGSLGVLPAPVLDTAAFLQTVLLSAGLFALGTSVRLRPLVRTGGRSLVLGAVGTLIVTAVAWAGIALAM